MISLKHAALFALTTGFIACGPMETQEQEQELPQAENALQTCERFEAVSHNSQEDACDMARIQGAEFCESRGGVSSYWPCLRSAFGPPWRGGLRVCCNQ
ncbi:hypothetical protein A176_006146 [Myxococcus hansupus]|uniref:Lipoprotein n=1 Tax=Pseudomyxococcus hansupus TaxID=1297742 RepID=A0A0H4X264_9BACT|nr:hypothetical protein [Myxococcus hansupus]AKQ69234.1 hypothetical protein A176_006146 [Myxococcus hansupus]